MAETVPGTFCLDGNGSWNLLPGTFCLRLAMLQALRQNAQSERFHLGDRFFAALPVGERREVTSAILARAP
jgi:hypothetical protein